MHTIAVQFQLADGRPNIGARHDLRAVYFFERLEMLQDGALRHYIFIATGNQQACLIKGSPYGDLLVDRLPREPTSCCEPISETARNSA